MSETKHTPGPSDSEDTSLLTVLSHTLSSLEYFFKKAHPDWDGSADAGSTIGDARAAIAKGAVIADHRHTQEK
jgi:hypothetical protein